MCEPLSTIIGLIFSGLLGLLTALIIEKAKRPRLRIRTCDHSEHSDNGRPMGSVHLVVEHLGINWFKSWIYPAPALACVAQIKILRTDRIEALPAPYEARWIASQQPPEFKDAKGGIWPSVFELLKKRDIFPHTEEKIDVCIKYEGEDWCYVFNNDSYVHGYRAEKHKLPSGIYIVEASVRSGDIVVKKEVRLRNDFPMKEFRIEEI